MAFGPRLGRRRLVNGCRSRAARWELRYSWCAIGWAGIYDEVCERMRRMKRILRIRAWLAGVYDELERRMKRMRRMLRIKLELWGARSRDRAPAGLRCRPPRNAIHAARRRPRNLQREIRFIRFIRLHPFPPLSSMPARAPTAAERHNEKVEIRMRRMRRMLRIKLELWGRGAEIARRAGLRCRPPTQRHPCHTAPTPQLQREIRFIRCIRLHPFPPLSSMPASCSYRRKTPQ